MGEAFEELFDADFFERGRDGQHEIVERVEGMFRLQGADSIISSRKEETQD